MTLIAALLFYNTQSIGTEALTTDENKKDETADKAGWCQHSLVHRCHEDLFVVQFLKIIVHY